MKIDLRIDKLMIYPLLSLLLVMAGSAQTVAQGFPVASFKRSENGNKDRNAKTALAVLGLDDQAARVELLLLSRAAAVPELKGCHFLERTRLEEIKREHRLASANLDDLRLDAIKNVNLFVIVKNRALLIFDAASGMRLVDKDLPADSELAVSTVIEGIIAARRKAAAIQKGELLLLGFMPLIPVNLNKTDVPQKIEQAMHRAAAAVRNQGVLERRHLGLLLNEPNYDLKQLNRKLLTSAVLVRPALVRKDGKFVLTVFFSLPGQMQTFKSSSISIDLKQDLVRQLEPFITVIPANKARDARNAEAGDFASEALFSSKHMLHRSAVITAENAVALDKKQELLLGYISAYAAYNAWGNWGSAPPKLMGMTAKNFATAVNIAEKHRQFNFVLMRFVSKWGYVHRGTFERLPPDIQISMRKSFERFARLAHELNLRWLKPPADQSAGSRIVALNNRARYLNSMAYLLDQAWDYRYWKQYIIPELKIYLAELDALTPELLAFYALPQKPRRAIYGISNINPDISNIGYFSNRHLAPGNKDYSILVETCEMLKQSRSLNLAQRGVNFLHQRKSSESGFVAACLEITTHCVYIGDRQTVGVFANNHAPLSFEARLKIWDAYADKLAVYNGVNLLGNIQKITLDRARQLQAIILEREKRLDADKRVTTNNKQRYKKFFFAGLRRRLCSVHPELNREIVFDDPFARVIEFAPETRRHVSKAVDKDGKIYYVIHDMDKACLLSVDTKDNFRVKRYPEFIDKRNNWYGWMGFTAATPKHIAFQNGPYVTLFGLDGSKPEILDFSEYYNEGANGLVCGGNRLFISYGKWAGHQTPGIVLEYNLATGKTKVIVSTLDRSVDWPLKGRTSLFYVTAMQVDPRRKCLMIIMPERLNGDHNSSPVRLWGYFWKRGSWRPLSGLLPIPDHNTGREIYLQDDGVYINGNGIWKVDFKGKVHKIFSGGGETRMVSDNLVFESGSIRFIKANKRLYFRRPFRTDLVVDHKYVVPGSCHGSALRVCVLKSREELLAAAKQIPSPNKPVK